MEHRYLLTIDVGTSSTKTGLWRADGQLMAQAAYAYPLTRLKPLWAEIAPHLWWDAICLTIGRVISSAGIHAKEIAGIGVDGIGWTLIPVDSQCNPLYPAMIWMDRRATDESAWLQAQNQAKVLVELSANPLDPAYITPKLLWLRNHQPAVFDQAAKFLTCSGFAVGKLTGELTCDLTQAYGFHFFDIRRERWDSMAAQAIGVPLEQMPTLARCTEIVGRVTARAAAETGLVAGIPVIAGCLDAAVGALGAGVVGLGQANEQGGQAGGMAISVDHVIVEPQLIFSHHVLKGQYLLQGGTVGGGSLGWFRDVLGQANLADPNAIGQSAFDQFNLEVEKTPPGANGVIFLPYMAGERTPLWNNNARGVFFGLAYKTTRGDLLRAIMEGCAFAVYHNIQVAARKGVAALEYLGSGGATASAVWCQIKADIYNRPFIVAQPAEGGTGGHLLGLFALTAQAVGFCADAGETVAGMLRHRREFTPSAERHALYQDLFGIYMDVSEKLAGDFDRLAQITSRE